MKLWLLRPNPANESAWEPWYDKTFGFVVRAETEVEARAFADENAGRENRSEALKTPYGIERKDIHPWLDPTQSFCYELVPEVGDVGVIIEDNWRS